MAISSDKSTVYAINEIIMLTKKNDQYSDLEALPVKSAYLVNASPYHSKMFLFI